MKKRLGPKGTEALRQTVVADQAKAQTEVAKTKRKPPPKKAKAPDARKITILAKTNPHAAGSRRAGWFKKLANGMTVDEAVALGVRGIYLQRMSKRGVLKLGG
jgi:hypothetical protein